MSSRAGELRFQLPGRGQALFTARSHGNMSSLAGDGAERASQMRERLRREARVQQIARGHQVHGKLVRCLTEMPAPEPEGVPPDDADGQATALGGLGVMVLGADCLPVALGSEGAVAMLHAGWRGLAGGVLEQGVKAVRALEEAPEIVAVLGPCAGPCCYEVGPEVHRALGRESAARARIDLREIARERLLAAGVSEVILTSECTICDERFFSHRREGDRAGRQAGLAWLS
jgi:YfiH family protein